MELFIWDYVLPTLFVLIVAAGIGAALNGYISARKPMPLLPSRRERFLKGVVLKYAPEIDLERAREFNYLNRKDGDAA